MTCWHAAVDSCNDFSGYVILFYCHVRHRAKICWATTAIQSKFQINICVVYSPYYINGIELPCLSQCRDLGVIITCCPLHFTYNILLLQPISAPTVSYGVLSGNVKSLVRAFIVYARSLLENSSVIWSPRLIQGITKIEKVQRHFTKRLRGLKHLSYSDRLNKLDLPSLELRRLHLDLVYCYKIVFGLVKLIFFWRLRFFSSSHKRAFVQTV